MQDVIETTVPGLVLVKKSHGPYYHLITGWGTPLAWCTCEERGEQRCPVIREWAYEQDLQEAIR